MINRYPGRCRRCGGTVPAGAGTVERVDGAWVVECADGECPMDGIPSGTPIWVVGDDRQPGDVFRAYVPAEHDAPGLHECAHRRTGIVVAIATSSEWISEDGMSFGLPDDQGWIHHTRVRPATDEEARPVLEAEAAAAEHRRRLTEARELWDAAGVPATERIADPHPESETIELTSSILGWRVWFAIEPPAASPRRIVRMEYRGADGDAWGEFSGGYCTHAIVAPWTAELDAAVRVIATADRRTVRDASWLAVPEPAGW